MNTISEAASALREGRSSARALLEASRVAAESAASLNALAWVDWDQAGRAADALDAQARTGSPLGALHGIPVSIKDLFNVAGMPTRGGTRAPLHELGAAEASLVTRLREAGALIFAKTNLHEVALGATGENRWTGDVCNPFDPSRQAGDRPVARRWRSLVASAWARSAATPAARSGFRRPSAVWSDSRPPTVQFPLTAAFTCHGPAITRGPSRGRGGLRVAL